MLKEGSNREAVVFTEGFDENSTDYLDFLQAERDKINSVKVEAGAVDEFIEILKYLATKETLPSTARTAFEYLIIKRLIEISNSGIEMSKEKLTELMNVCVAVLGGFDPHTINERMIKAGASIKTFVDGEYRIAPIESSVLLDKIKAKEGELRVLEEEMSRLAPQVKDSDEVTAKYNDIALQYQLLRAEMQSSLILDEREDYAIKLIQGVVEQQGTANGVVPMLYGASHDFSNNIRYANNSGEQRKVGLITAIPKVFEGVRR